MTCGGTAECEDCVDSCQLSPETYAYGNKLFNLGDDPREEHDLFDQYPEVKRLFIFLFFYPHIVSRLLQNIHGSPWSPKLGTLDVGKVPKKLMVYTSAIRHHTRPGGVGVLRLAGANPEK